MKTVKTLLAIILITIMSGLGMGVASADDGGLSATVNVYRNSNGLGTLPVKAELAQRAQQKANELAQADNKQLSHPDKSGFPQPNLSLVGVEYSVNDVVNKQWAADPDQRANMLNAGMTHIGSGSKQAPSGRVYAVTIMAKYPVAVPVPVPAPVPVVEPIPVAPAPAPVPAPAPEPAPIVEPVPVAPAPAPEPAPVVEPMPVVPTVTPTPTPTVTATPTATATPSVEPAEPTESSAPKEPEVEELTASEPGANIDNPIKPALGYGGLLSMMIGIPFLIRTRKDKKEMQE